MTQLWRIEQLAELAARALQAAPYNGQPSGRVRAVPDLRTIRYYTTIGLLDGPEEMRGRTAYYGPRHLLQLVAIKRLQARGLPLVEVQKCLAAADDKTLARCADLPGHFLAKAVSEVEGRWPAPSLDGPSRAIADAAEDSARCRQFWAAVPTFSRADGLAATASVSSRPAVILRLNSRVSLLVEGEEMGPLDEATVAEVRPAIEALLDALGRTGVLQTPTHDRGGSKTSTHKEGGEDDSKREHSE